MKKYFITLLACLLVLPCTTFARNNGQTLKLAVASNFRTAAIEIANIFTSQTGHEVNVSSASTGQIYAQIINGASFDIFLSADESTPVKLENSNLTVVGSRFTYAFGRLALLNLEIKTSNSPKLNVAEFDTFNKIAIANPKLAPYGAAAIDVLKNLALYDSVVNKIVYGGNINQTFQYVESGAADIGFVSLSQIKSYYPDDFDEYWIIPDEFHRPINQQAVLLQGKESKVAYEFLSFMKSELVKKILKEKYGYYLE